MMLDWQGKTWLKIISAVLIIAFLTYDIAWATDFSSTSQRKDYASRSLFKNKKVDHDAIKAKNEENLNNIKDTLSHKKNNNTKDSIYHKDLNNSLKAYIKEIASIYIPDTIGKVVDSYTSPDSKATIIHIQDLHINPEASFNLASILEILVEDYNLGLVCSEGAEGEVDTSSVSSFPDPSVREKVAKVFINSGELTGEEYLSITKYPDLPIWGIEDKDAYFQHIVEFNKIMKFSPNALTFISEVKEALDKLKPKIYSKELLDIDSKETQYQESQLDTAKYLDYLLSRGQACLSPTMMRSHRNDNYQAAVGTAQCAVPTKYKNIAIFRDSLEAEKTIDQQKIIQDSQNLLTSLQSVLKDKDNKSEIETLLTRAALYRDKKISPFSFYSYLDELARRHLKEDINKYPDLFNYISYLRKINSLDSSKLFNEIEELAYEIKDMLSIDDNQKLLTKSLRNINFLENFFNLKVSNEELEYYLKDKDSFKESWFKSAIEVLDSAKYSSSGQESISWKLSREESLIDKNLPILENFYELAHKRDLAMFNNATSEIETRKPKLTALIAGGFHTQGITKLLKEKGYSYVVISPYSKTGIDEENYRNLLSGKRKPIQDLIKDLNGSLRAMLMWVKEEFREDFQQYLQKAIDAGIIEKDEITLSDPRPKLICVMAACIIQIFLERQKPIKELASAFESAFTNILKGDITVKQAKDESYHINYEDQYIAVTKETLIVPSGEAIFNASKKEPVVIRSTKKDWEKTQKITVKVLAVDDEPHMLEAIAATLKTIAKEELKEENIITASTMDEGLQKLAASPDINFLVLDFRLDPFDYTVENGVQLCKQAFKKYNFKGKVIIYSADDTQIISELKRYSNLWDMYLQGQISIQLKHDTRAFEDIKARIVGFARGEKVSAEADIDMRILEEELPLEAFAIKPDDIGVSPNVIDQFKTCHVIIADDKPFIRNAIGAMVKGFFDDIHKTGTVEDVVALVKELREQGIPDEKIIILSDYEFGTEQTGIRRSDGRDLLNMLRLHQDSGYPKETLNFKGFFLFISGSIISKDQMPGFSRSAKDIAPEIKTQYGIDYIEKNADEDFPVTLLRLLYGRLQSPYAINQVITKALPSKEMSKPADISFLNGGVNDFEMRLKMGLRQLKDLLTELTPGVKDKEKLKKIEEDLSKMSTFFEFGNVDRKLPFNARAHNYKGRIFYVAGYLVPQIRKEIEGLSQPQREKLEPFVKQLDSLTLTMGVAANYMLRLLRLSSAVGNIEMPITFEEFKRDTVEIFLADYGDRVIIETDFNEGDLKDLKFPYGLTFVISFILDNAFDQYQLKYGKEFKGKIYFKVNKEQKIIEISIIDEAGGIAKDILPHIFQRKFGTKPLHPGYGLFWAKQLIEMFDGEITARNEGSGACFSIKLPTEWQGIVETKQQIPEELVQQVFQVLSERGILKAEELAEQIAKEIHAYSAKISEITQTRETISYETYLVRGHEEMRYKIEDMLITYFQFICTEDYQIFRDIVFEKDTTQEDIENLLLSLLALKEVEKKEDIVFSYLQSRQAVVLKYDTGGRAQILLRSKENLEREKEGITQELREKYQRVLRQVGYAIHKLGGDVGLMSF
ncbi:MAG: hypothetical protein KJ706_00215, partial [Candidatus Omnitrophica bacterium]|nr:hypothetical protein [Candidatus Omnitrophota bacterium]